MRRFRAQQLFVTFIISGLLLPACSGTIAADPDAADMRLTEIEQRLASGGGKTELCAEYLGICEQGLGLCLEGNNAETYQTFCSGLQQRCRTTAEKYCRAPQADAGPVTQAPRDAGTPPEDAGTVSPPDAGTVAGPVISAVSAVDITQTTANISWTLNEFGTGQVEYGTTTAYGQTSVKETSFKYSAHLQALSRLAPGTLYHYRVHSANQSGLESVSADFTFTTAASAGGSFVAPTLVDPKDPMSFGAKCDGVSDDTAAFQAAINAGDVLVPAGKTCVINGTVQINTSNKHLECGSGTILKQTIIGGTMFSLIPASGSDRGDIAGGSISGDSIVNCHFIGTNSVAPQADWNDGAKHWNIPILTRGTVDNFLLAGNTFERFWGQSMFQTAAHINGGSGDRIIYNTFKSCGYYGPVFVAHRNGLIARNTMIDCAAGVENDDTIQYSGGNIIEHNTLTCVYGYGGPDMNACAMLTGGVTQNANYSTNIVRNNVISGRSSGGFQPSQPSKLYIGTRFRIPYPAQYSNNTCTNGCIIVE